MPLRRLAGPDRAAAPPLRLHPLDARSGRMVLQAWIASRGLIALVALLLAMTAGPHPDRHGQQLGRPALREARRGRLLRRARRHPDGLLPGPAGDLEHVPPAGRPGGDHRRRVVHWSAPRSRRSPWSGWAGRGRRSPGCSPRPRCSPPSRTRSRCSARPPSGPGSGPVPTAGSRAAALAAVACTVRVSGLFLVGALFVMIITTRQLDWRSRLRRLALLAIPMAVIWRLSPPICTR